MIVTVKRSKKQKIIKLISLLAVVGMFTGYYFYMEEEFKEKQRKDLEAQKIAKIEEEKKDMNRYLERFIYKEVEKAIDLIGQENILYVKIIQKKIVIVCDLETNLEALIVRYGTMALIKKTIDDIKIAIDLKYIVESKFNEK